MFKKKRTTGDVQIELYQLEDRPFYVPGDHIKGAIILNLDTPTTFQDVQVKVRCDEYATVSTDRSVMDYDFRVGVRQPNFGTRDVKERRIKRDQSIVDLATYDASFRHFELITTVSNHRDPRKQTTSDQLLKNGQRFEFDILLPHTADSCPPECEITDRLGIYWTLKAVVHRSGLKKNIRKEIKLAVYPPQSGLSYRFGDWQVLHEVSKEEVFHLSRLNAKTQSHHVLNVMFGISEAGLVQPLPACSEMRPQIKLVLDALKEPIFVRRAEVYLVVVCESAIDKKALRTTQKHPISLGVIPVNRKVSPHLDLSKEALETFKLRMIQAPAFDATYISVKYQLKLVLACELSRDSVHLVEAETGFISVIDPFACIEAVQLPRYTE